MSFFDDVNRWHEKMKLPQTNGRTVHLMSQRDFQYRSNFLFEELREFIEMHQTGDIPGAADALVDLVWVALGTACYLGIPFNELWEEVRRANYEKRPWREGDPIKPRNYVEGEIVKPLGWRSPDIRGVLKAFAKK